MTTSSFKLFIQKTLSFIVVMIISILCFGNFRSEKIRLETVSENNLNSTESIQESAIADFQLNSLTNTISENLISTEFENDDLSSNLSGSSTFQTVTTPYFTKIYNGNGIDHMNINLVNLNQTGILVGDEIGIFDGIYCVGDGIIEIKNLTNNNISIPASANDTIESQPNGFIDGHIITLKLYHLGIVYLLNYQTVNNSQDIFAHNGSMFAQVDFPLSNGLQLNQFQSIRIFPNPFDNKLIIELTIIQKQKLDVSIYNQNGKLIRSLFSGMTSGQLSLSWDGKDNNQIQVSSGQYYCKVNETITKIIYNRK